MMVNPHVEPKRPWPPSVFGARELAPWPSRRRLLQELFAFWRCGRHGHQYAPASRQGFRRCMNGCGCVIFEEAGGEWDPEFPGCRW